LTVGPPAACYAADLLRRLQAGPAVETGCADRPGYADEPEPAVDWAASGAMALTGLAGGPPLVPEVPLATAFRGAALTWRALATVVAGSTTVVAGSAGTNGRPACGLDESALDGPALAGERAAVAGLTRRGGVSPGGTCRLLPAADRWIAVNLARPADVELVPTWLGCAVLDDDDPWPVVTAAVAGQRADDVVGRAQELGIPAAVAVTPEEAAADEQARARGQTFPPSPFLLQGEGGAPGAGPWSRGRPPLVVDLSSLWAGPLCGQLLLAAGCRVVKVESTARPDGTRGGPPGFFDLLNGGKESVALDLTRPDGRRALSGLVEAADVVVDSSRPRAMAQLDIDPDEVVAARPGRTWVSITAYGRRGPWANRVGFGDDVAVAGGLALMPAGGDGPVFCADAIADPLTGLHAAVAALAGLIGGGGHVVDLAMREVVGHAIVPSLSGPVVAAPASGPGPAAAPPRARPVTRPGPALGHDTARVLAELGTG